MRDTRKLEKLEAFLNQLEDLTWMSLTLAIPNPTWLQIKKYVGEVQRQSFPDHPMPNTEKLSKMVLIQQMIEACIQITIPRYKRIAVLLDNEDFSANERDRIHSKSIFLHNIAKAVGLTPSNVGIGFKYEFNRTPVHLALILVPDLIAGAMGGLLNNGSLVEPEKSTEIEKWIINSRQKLKGAHFTGIVEFNPKQTTVSLHSWNSSEQP